MKYSLSCLCLGLLGYLFSPAAILAKQPVVSTIGNIQDTKEIAGGGCSLHRKGKQDYVFWSTDSKFALMNIDGKDRTLKLVRETQSSSREKKGDRSTSVYKFGKIVVQIDRVATRVCRQGDVECESTSYDGKIKLSIGDRQQVISVEGECGS
jgi:hypothetical protein